MRTWLIAAVLVFAGCGNSGDMNPTQSWPMTAQTTWNAHLNGGQPPSCNGPMAVTVSQETQGGPVAVSGSWNCVESVTDCSYVQAYQDIAHVCISYAGPVTGSADPSGNATFTLQTDSAHAITVTGTMSPTVIVGFAAFSNESVPFAADLQ